MEHNTIKAIYGRPTADIILNEEEWRTFPLRQGTGKVSTLTTPFQHSTRSPRQSHQARKRNNSHSNRKGRSKIWPYI